MAKKSTKPKTDPSRCYGIRGSNVRGKRVKQKAELPPLTVKELREYVRKNPDKSEAKEIGIPQLKPATIRKLLDAIAIEKKQVDNLDLNRYGKPADWRK